MTSDFSWEDAHTPSASGCFFRLSFYQSIDISYLTKSHLAIYVSTPNGNPFSTYAYTNVEYLLVFLSFLRFLFGFALIIGNKASSTSPSMAII